MKHTRTILRFCLGVGVALGVSVGLILAAALPAWSAQPAADLILRNGQIYTQDAKQPWVDAVAIRRGVYMAVGKEKDVKRWIGPQTKVVDLQGAMAMPGINDVHQHPLDGGYEMLYACNFASNIAFEAMLESIRGCAQRAEPGDWIVGGAWGSQHQERLSQSDALRQLDAVSGGHPVFLRDDTFHNRWINSEALRLAGIVAATPSPEGGVIVKDAASGTPSGLIKEFPAFRSVEALIPPRQEARKLHAIKQALAVNNGYGITGIQDAYTSDHALQLWSAQDKKEGLSAWLVASLPAMPSPDPTERYGDALVTVRDQFRSPHVRPDFAKVFLDGVPPARTALFLEPYLEDTAHGAHFHGHANYELAELTAAIARLDKKGVPVKIHATGDGSVRLALDAIASVRQQNGMRGPRHHVAHVSFVAPEDIRRFRQLNVVADESPMLWFPTGLWFATQAVIGPERAARFWPVKDLLAAGAPVAGGSDWPAGQDTPNPWIGIEGLVTRRNPLGEIPGALWPEQAIDLAAALKVYTLDSANAMGLGKLTGSVTKGKSADLIVLDRNLFQTPPDKLHETQVMRTYFQGKAVFSR